MRATWEDGPHPVNFDGMWAGYRRLSSLEKVTPPFVWSGTVKLNAVMDPPVFGYGWKQGQTATYKPKLNWHPLYPSNNRNIVVGVGAVENPTAIGISAEMRDVRPEKPYGVRTGYVKRDRTPLPSSPIDGKWHHFVWDVPAPNHYRLLWDGVLVADIVEKLPATIDRGPVSVGLRLDFLDVELGPMNLEEGGRVTVEQRAPDHIRFLSAEQWGRVLKHPMKPENLNDPETYVHHTAGNPYHAWTGEQAMKELQRQSHNKGYATVAYDAVIHRSSNGIISIMEGRGAWRSAATLDRNEEGEAICMMGYFQPGHSLSAQPTDSEIEAIAWGIAWMQEKGWSAKDTKILGHRDNPRHLGVTSCPGDYLWVKLPRIRELVRTINTPTPPKPPDSDKGGHSVFQKMIRQRGDIAVFALYSGGYKTWVPDEQTRDFLHFVSGRGVEEIPKSDTFMRATGPILGPIPTGYDEWGIKK